MTRRHTIRQALVQHRREVLGRYRSALERADEELAQRDAEHVERASEEWDARVLSLLGHGDLQEIARLTDAIRRIDDGTWGMCDECGVAIEARRLRALPTTTRCIECALDHEVLPRAEL